ncbi:hypothetical protein ACFSKW_46795 [Nonomuraea mangrovi]|uniref:Secreted protein n=1 Tax=Nonomuraea mangrovi TaxID=2316207 RepID=A0ABW4TDG0_9ACTN
MANLALAGSVSVVLGASLCSAALASPVTEDQFDSSEVEASDPNPHNRPSLRREAHRKCRPRAFFRFHNFRPRNFFIPRTRFVDGPGGTMTATVRRQHRVYFEIEIERIKASDITTTFDRQELVRALANNVNPLIAEEHVVEAGHDYTHEVSKGKYGNLWYRVFGYRVGFSAWRQFEDCRVNRVATGIANVPSRVEGWRYWETVHPTFHGRVLSPK